MKRALASRAAETYVLASNEKIGTASRYGVLPLNAIAGIITDTEKSSHVMSELAAAGVPLIHATERQQRDR